MNSLLAFLQSASNTAAGAASGPVDLIGAALRKAGVPVPKNALMSSEWMRQNGLMREVPQSAASLAGETFGLLSPVVAAAKAPQIARGLLAMGENAAAPRTMNAGKIGAQRGAIGMPDYGMSHRPMTVDQGAATLDDLVPAFGDDIYTPNAVQYFGTGDRTLDRETVRVLQSVRGKPDATVTIYRAVPKDAGQTAMNAGDWVTVNKRYAQQHGESLLNGEYKLIEQKVPASWLTTNADSFHEQGFYPR